MGHTYKNLIFTKHAWERINDRSLTVEAIYRAVQSPDQVRQKSGNRQFIRTLNSRKVYVVATPTEKNRWVVISAWVRGEEDKVPLIWQLITLPFKIIWWAVKTIFRLMFGKKHHG